MIEDNVPIPQTMQARTEHGDEARRLKVGQSVFHTDHSKAETVRSTIYKLGGKSQSRKRNEPENGGWGWRVWRIQ